MVLEAAFKTRRQDSVIVNVPVPLAHNCSAEQQWYDLRGRRKMTSARLNIKYVLPALPTAKTSCFGRPSVRVFPFLSKQL